MLFIAGFVIGGAVVGAAWYFWPKIKSEQRDLQKKAGEAIKDQVNKL
jgi:hypothetical protein